jgi:tyrosyl-tRNA synthetase
MGRKDTDEMSAAQILYPCMQCADIFFLKVRQGRARALLSN